MCKSQRTHGEDTWDLAAVILKKSKKRDETPLKVGEPGYLFVGGLFVHQSRNVLRGSGAFAISRRF
jgi:hypothetical protein